MSEKKDKRRNSFRKLIPSLFSSKVRPKENETSDPAILKTSLGNNRRDNQYENPKSTRNNINDNSIYENLSVTSEIEIISDASISFDSSSSTLVGESASNNKNSTKTHNARPQVPPKPTNDSVVTDNAENSTCYPDVYYHSLEELTDNVTPLGEIEIHKADYRHRSPTAVGAEIKKVSTKFLISPKKEAEVRTNRPKRARSLSLDKEKSRQAQPETESVNKDTIQKPYTYSAPTSPMAKNHKIPSMPGKTSPYDTVRKALNDAETRRLSLRKSVSPPPTDPHIDVTRNRSATPTSMRGSSMETVSSQSKVSQGDISDREKTRQNVEAFYWKKLKELKIKEDELLKNTLNKAINASSDEKLRYNENAYPLSDNSDIRYKNNVSYIGRSPFVRGAPERATDSMIRPGQSLIVYRRKNGPDVFPKKHSSLIVDIARQQDQNTKRTSFDDTRSSNSLTNKRVSAPGCINEKSVPMKFPSTPPTPPLRTTSVNSAILTECRKLLNSEPYQASCDNPVEQHAPEKHVTTNLHCREDDWQRDGSKADGGVSDGETTRGPSRGRPSRRDDPRRHTLAGNHLYMHHHHPGQFNSHEMEGHRHKQNQGPYNNTPHYAVVNKNTSNRNNLSSILLNSEARLKKPPLPRSCQQDNGMLFDDDPGIMSEVETSSTGFRRGGKQRSSLPVVRTPSKTLERPLGLVFLQYRSETKRALLPNEITSIDTVKALFVRSFPKQLSMQYMDSPLVKIYIHDSSKDMFYELEDVRAHLREIRDRSVLRLFEATDISGGVFPGSVGVGTVAMPPTANACSGPSSWDQDQSYFSEPEIDSEYHHQHVHKTKVKAPAYYMGTAAPSTLPRGGSGAMVRAYSPAAPSLSEREGYMSSPERAGSRVPYEDPYYSQYMGPGPGRATITPIIDEEASDGGIEDAYVMYGGPVGPRPMPRAPYERPAPGEEMQRLRVEKMERQLANLTGLVQKALQVPGGAPAPAARQDYNTYTRPVSQDMTSYGSVDTPPNLGKDKFQKSVSFEKSVSFSDDPPDMNSPKQHSPQHSADTKPTKPAIKSSTLPRTSSQERDRLKPAPPPKPVGLVGQQMTLPPLKTYTVNVSSDFMAQLNKLQIQSRDLMLETRNLRRSTLTQAMQMRQMLAEAIVKIGDLAAKACEHNPDMQFTREEEIYRHEMLLLENDLYELEATVERLRGQAANRSEETRVNMADVERIAMVLSKSSKTVANWKLKFPMLQDAIRNRLGGDVEKRGTLQVVRRERLLEEEPERLELALRRCKKLTGTLVTLKRLACVQEQRLPLDGRESPSSSHSSTFCSTTAPSSEEFAFDSNSHLSQNSHKGSDGRVNGSVDGEDVQRSENALDALLDELQTFSSGGGAATVAPADVGSAGLRRLHSYPSGSDTDASPPVRARGLHPPKPPVPERHPELVALAGSRRAPPPPPPRTTSRSPLASPTALTAATIHPAPAPTPAPTPALATEHDSQSILEQRHRDLLKKQKALQEQYARLQMIQRSGPVLTSTTYPDLKKTGSESNLLSKMNLNMTTAPLSGSMTHLAGSGRQTARAPLTTAAAAAGTTTNKVYETDIL